MSNKSFELERDLIASSCHWHSIPVATQVFRLGSLVVSLAIELGINQKPLNDVSQHEMIVGTGSRHEQSSSSKLPIHEARRAYVGAFVVST